MRKDRTIKLIEGFTVIELMTSLIISSAVFWGIMTLYLDITKSHTQDQIIEEIQFNLSMAMDQISDSIKIADSIAIVPTTQFDGIRVMRINQSGSVSSNHTYTCEREGGIMLDNNPLKLPGYHLFDENGPYYVEIDDFELEDNVITNSPSDRLKNNYYNLKATFILSSPYNDSFEKTFTFQREILALNQFSQDNSDDEE